MYILFWFFYSVFLSSLFSFLFSQTSFSLFSALLSRSFSLRPSPPFFFFFFFSSKRGATAWVMGLGFSDLFSLPFFSTTIAVKIGFDLIFFFFFYKVCSAMGDGFGVFWILVVSSVVAGVIDLEFYFFIWFVGMDFGWSRSGAA